MKKFEFGPTGYKIFLDRYSLKVESTREAKKRYCKKDQLVLVQPDPKIGHKSVGRVTKVSANSNGDFTEISVKDTNLGDEVTVSSLDYIDIPLEESAEEVFSRVAIAASLSKNYAGEGSNFLHLLEDFKFCPGGRILASLGSGKNLTSYNCFVIPRPKDSCEGIVDTLNTQIQIMRRGGGVGINLSSLRPRHSSVVGVNGKSSGSVSWAGIYSYTTNLIEQGGSRRGALMLILEDWHPDIEEFISVKEDMSKLTGANLSVGVSDAFMDAVKQDLDWTLFFPNTNDPSYSSWNGEIDDWEGEIVVHKKIKARELWSKLVGSAWKSGEPGLWFKDRSNADSPMKRLIGTNPCGEQPLPGYSVCNLGSINLPKFVKENGNFDWRGLESCVSTAVKFLDAVIDVNSYFLSEVENNQRGERRVGLGTMGLAEAMIRMGIRYGSDESIDFIDNLYSYIAYVAYSTSSQLAREFGTYEGWNYDVFQKSEFFKRLCAKYPAIEEHVEENGLRNITLLTAPPTGTTGTMLNTSTGIEPYFDWEYTRKSLVGMFTETVPVYQQWKENKSEGETLPPHFVTSKDLTPEEHVKVAAMVQKWTDSAVSKTANLPNHYSLEDTKKLYELMYDMGSKGGTVYRDGSRNIQVLETVKKDSKEGNSPLPASTKTTVPYRRTGVSYSKKTHMGTTHITINNNSEGDPIEMFVEVGKAGSDIKSMSEALGRLASMFLQIPGPLSSRERISILANQLTGVGGSGVVYDGGKPVSSVADAIGQVLEEEYMLVEDKENQKSLYDLCPECGNYTLKKTAGCWDCETCGFSKC